MAEYETDMKLNGAWYEKVGEYALIEGGQILIHFRALADVL